MLLISVHLYPTKSFTYHCSIAHQFLFYKHGFYDMVVRENRTVIITRYTYIMISERHDTLLVIKMEEKKFSTISWDIFCCGRYLGCLGCLPLQC